MANDDEHGAPVDFSGAVFPNPGNVKPKWDTDPKDVDEPVGAKMSIANPPADNDKANGITPKEHPLEEHFRKPSTVRHQLGRMVPKATNN